MVKVKDTILYISREVLDKLPDPERNKFELVNSWKPSYLSECFQYIEENDPDADWIEGEEGEPFKDLDDYEDWTGIDWDSCGTSVYKRTYDIFTGEDEKYSRGLAEGEEGNPIRIKYE